MVQKVYGLSADFGDGSSGVHWFKEMAKVKEVMRESHPCFEMYAANCGEPAETLTFPDGLDLDACGFVFCDDDDEMWEDDEE